MMPKFSVIIPIYNVSQYLDKCINSVLNQSFQDFEIILVDDGSLDISGKMCDDYAQKDERVKVIHKKNGGLSDARNAGMSIACGEYYYFLDGDDYVFEKLLEVTKTAIEQQQADMVVMNYQKVDEEGNVLEKIHFNSRSHDLHGPKQKYNYYVQTLLQYHQGWEAWNRIYKGSIIRDNNIMFTDNSRIFAEDLLFLMMYLQYADKIVCTEESLYNYLIRNNSIMSEKKEKFNAIQITTLAEFFYSFLERKKGTNYFRKKFYLIYSILLFNEGQNKGEEIISKGFHEIENNNFVHNMMSQFFGKTHSLVKYFELDYCQDLCRFCAKIYQNQWTCRAGLFRRIYNRIIRNGILPYLHYWKKSRNIYIIGSEDAGNLGDHQIVVSMYEFLTYCFPKYAIYEIPASNYQNELERVKKYVRKKDIICTPGGGNVGDVYWYSEKIRRDVIRNFPNNRIIIFPQTVYFSDTVKGNQEKNTSCSIYNQHKNLLLTVREKGSLVRAYEMLSSDKVKLFPDIVLFSDYKKSGILRKNVLLCLRSDLEGCLSKNDNDLIELSIKEHQLDFSYFDHQLDFDIPIYHRNEYLNDIMEKYRHSGLIITDRLHGMIFSAITGTPCIAFDNFNGKVSGVYQWITKVPYIKLCTNINDVNELIEELYLFNTETVESTRSLLWGEFMNLAKEVQP